MLAHRARSGAARSVAHDRVVPEQAAGEKMARGVARQRARVGGIQERRVGPSIVVRRWRRTTRLKTYLAIATDEVTMLASTSPIMPAN
jgi:hypothetical protein